MTFGIRAISIPDNDSVTLFQRALDDLQGVRGGPELRHEFDLAVGTSDAHEAVEKLARRSRLLVASNGESTLGLAALSLQGPGVILGLYVAPECRRQHVGEQLVNAALALDDPPRDAWVLPGDRATKSLYEKAGWKARRLTMSAGWARGDDSDA